MSEKINLLIVEDEAEIRELLALLISSHIPIEYYEAGSGSEAISLLANHNFDLVICDFNMPNGNGKFVFDQVQKLNPSPKYILLTSDDAHDHKDITEVQGVGYIQKPFEDELLMSNIGKILDLRPTDKNNGDYIPLSINVVRKLAPFPFEIFVKLGEEHFIKYFNIEKKITDEDIDKVVKKKITEFYVRSDNLKPFLESWQRTAFESLILPDHGLEHSFELTTLQNELVHLGIKGLIADEALMKLSEQNLKTVFNVSSKAPVLRDLLKWVDNQHTSPAKLHSVILTLFCNIIVKNWSVTKDNPKMPLIMTYASVLHDLNLNDYYIKNEWRIRQGMKMNSVINKSDQDVIGNHITEVMKIVNSWAHCPKEVLELIANHHEWPTGNGFPRNLTGDQIPPLSALFIVAHEASALVWERKSQEEFLQIMKNLLQDFKSYPHFLEPLHILLKEITKG